MKVFVALSLVFACFVRGDDVHHLRGDVQKTTATEMPVPAKDEVGAVAQEQSAKQEVAETVKGTETEASQKPAEEVGAVAQEQSAKQEVAETAEGSETEASQKPAQEVGAVAKEPETKEPAPKGPAAKPQDTSPSTGVHREEPDDEPMYYPLDYPEEEERGYDYGPDGEYIPEGEEDWDLDGYPDPEDFEEPVGVVVKESDPSDPSDPATADTQAVAAATATAATAVAAGKETSLLRRWVPHHFAPRRRPV